VQSRMDEIDVEVNAPNGEDWIVNSLGIDSLMGWVKVL
jgi:hypothetical protein